MLSDIMEDKTILGAGALVILGIIVCAVMLIGSSLPAASVTPEPVPTSVATAVPSPVPTAAVNNSTGNQTVVPTPYHYHTSTNEEVSLYYVNRSGIVASPYGTRYDLDNSGMSDAEIVEQLDEIISIKGPDMESWLLNQYQAARDYYYLRLTDPENCTPIPEPTPMTYYADTTPLGMKDLSGIRFAEGKDTNPYDDLAWAIEHPYVILLSE